MLIYFFATHEVAAGFALVAFALGLTFTLERGPLLAIACFYAARRGTYSGQTVKHLRDIGFTITVLAIILMPVILWSFVND